MKTIKKKRPSKSTKKTAPRAVPRDTPKTAPQSDEKNVSQNGKKRRRKFTFSPGKKRLPLPAVCYLLALAGLLALGALRLGLDALDRHAGRLVTKELTLADFTLVNAHCEGADTLVSDNEDPQLVYTPDGGRIDTLTLMIDYNMFPYERCVYYTTRPGEAFGQNKRVWATEETDGSLRFTLPRRTKSIRLDPGSRTALQMRFGDITLNAPREALAYFLPEGGGWFWLLVLPGLAAAVLQWLWEALHPLPAAEDAGQTGPAADAQREGTPKPPKVPKKNTRSVTKSVAKKHPLPNPPQGKSKGKNR